MDKFDKKIIYAEICPYCNEKPEYVDSKVIYGRSYGMIYLCRSCRAYVGVHKGTDKPLGRLADWKLRKAKKHAHQEFDRLWKKAMIQGRSKYDARTSAYKWLSKSLNIPEEFTHIGMFDIELCDQTIKLCEQYK